MLQENPKQTWFAESSPGAHGIVTDGWKKNVSDISAGETAVIINIYLRIDQKHRD